MKLTGKCKEDFLEKHKQPETFLFMHEDVYLNAIIIEFFDSVGIKIFPYPIANSDDFDSVILYKCQYGSLNVRTSRTQATNKAIIKANELFNENN